MSESIRLRLIAVLRRWYHAPTQRMVTTDTLEIQRGNTFEPPMDMEIDPWTGRLRPRSLADFRKHMGVEQVHHEKSAGRIDSSPNRGGSKSISPAPGIVSKSNIVASFIVIF